MSQDWTDADVRCMRRAVELSRNGFPAPNPHVGCVIARDGQIVGEGWHEYAGAPHAEVAALAAAGERARGADAYVTLEPCNHQGRTGPCSVALLEAGVRRVVYACPDPNPKAEGGGQRLKDAGVLIQSGLLEEEAGAANRQFLFAMAHGRPLVVVKAAMSLDGRIALPSGESKWITGELARRQGHRLRAELGSVLVGRRTVEVDNPQLTARIEGVRNQPTRIVLDPHCRLSGGEAIFDSQSETLWIHGEFKLSTLLADLYEKGITGVLVEGGGATIASFIKEGLVDRYELFVSPKLLGDGPSWIERLELTSLENSPRLKFTSSQMLGDDLWITAEPT